MLFKHFWLCFNFIRDFNKYAFSKAHGCFRPVSPLRWFSGASPWISGQGECPKNAYRLKLKGSGGCAILLLC